VKVFPIFKDHKEPGHQKEGKAAHKESPEGTKNGKGGKKKRKCERVSVAKRGGALSRNRLGGDRGCPPKGVLTAKRGKMKKGDS